jgi:SH3-like domain-containing protein
MKDGSKLRQELTNSSRDVILSLIKYFDKERGLGIIMKIKRLFLRMLAVLMSVVLICAFAAPAAMATAANARRIPGPFVVASTSGVRVRSGPGTNHPQVGSVRLGAVVQITRLSSCGQWGYIPPSRPIEGWIFLDPLVPGNPTNWVVNVNSLNLRQRADVNSGVIARLPRNTQVTVTDTVKRGGFTWGRVAYARMPNNEWYMRMGWVALDHCRRR